MKKKIRIIIAIIASLLITIFNINRAGNSPITSIFSVNKIDKMISKMTLREKIGQMIIVDFRNYDVVDTNTNKTPMLVLNEDYGKALGDLNIGGIILFSEVIESNEQVIRLIDDAQTYRTDDNNLNQIPLLVMIDQEGGIIERASNITSFTSNMALAATNNTDYAYKQGLIVGEELSILGINTNLAPVVDINSNPNNPVIGTRSYSDDPSIVYEFAKNYIGGLNDSNVISCLKHFPGHGNTETDSHTGLPVVNKTYSELLSFELEPFKRLIEDGTELILTAHIQYPLIENNTYYSTLKNEVITLPATLSKTIINDILRVDLGFDGVVVSDSLVMDAIDTYFTNEEAAELAINAGVDMLLMPIQIDSYEDLVALDDYITMIETMVINGEIKESVIDEHVKRILTLKDNHNLLEYKEINVDQTTAMANDLFLSDEHLAISSAIRNDSLTLYKANLELPLNLEDNQKITFLYPYYYQYYALKESVEELKDKNLINETIEFKYIQYSDSSTIKELEKLIKDSDYVIIINTIYDSKNFDSIIKFKTIVELIDKQVGKDNKVIAVSSNLPYDANYLANSDVTILTFSPDSTSLKLAIIKLFEGEFKGVLPINLDY